MLFFIPLVSTIVLKAADYDLYVGKPSSNILAMVKNMDDSLNLTLKKGSSSDETSHFVEMRTNHYMGINRKNQISMNGHSWGLPKTNWKFILNTSGSLSIVSNEICLGFRPARKQLRPVDCKDSDYDINFTLINDERLPSAEKAMMEIEFGGKPNFLQDMGSAKGLPDVENEQSSSQSDEDVPKGPTRKFVKYNIEDLYKHL